MFCSFSTLIVCSTEDGVLSTRSVLIFPVSSVSRKATENFIGRGDEFIGSPPMLRLGEESDQDQDWGRGTSTGIATRGLDMVTRMLADACCHEYRSEV